MIKHSFIGDMWKCAMNIKNRFIDNGEEHTQIVITHLDGKFTYLIVFPILNYDLNVAVLDTDSMTKNRDTYVSEFNVKCEYVLVNNKDKISFYGMCIQ